MNYFKKIFRFAKPYRKYAALNIFFNIFYALFSALSFVSLIPMLDVLFGEDKDKIVSKPVYTGLLDIGDYGKNYMGYYIQTTSEEHGQQYVLYYLFE